MPKINVLDSSIYNRISAGEVVERPSSVVKELIENALDAKAQNIIIEIENGGTKLIKITDNGCGIDFSELKKVFLPHATSKVNSINDLDGIITFGFRGEALASIASVSQVDIISNTQNQEIGGKISANGGLISEVEECASPVGTTIIVKNLFFNTPARLKFLKSNKQEESAITNIVNRLMLANPTICFKYIVDGKVFYNANSKTLKDKIYTIYGKSVLENLIEVKNQKDGYTLYGFISNPVFCKANKTYQTLLVNNRYVINSLVGVAVTNAYENFLMKGKFPLFILNLQVNYKDVDVNVHPSKMEVKFKTSNTIYSFIYSTILESLNNNNCPIAFDTKINNFSFETDEPIQNENVEDNKNAPKLQHIDGGFSFGKLNSLQEKLSNLTVSIPKTTNDDIILKSSNYNFSEVKNETNEQKLNTNLFEDDYFKVNPCKQEVKTQQQFELDIDYKIVGTLFNTYIVVESDNNIYILDQHAGHERVLFDKFINDFENKKIVTQDLLLPYTFNVNEIEEELIENNKDSFLSLGFNIEKFGFKTYKITSIPSMLTGINLEEFIFDALKDTNKISKTNEQIKNYFATCACKAAVKGGQNLSENEVKTLLKLIISNKTTLLCPHGRPICLNLTKEQLEKMFKRIV